MRSFLPTIALLPEYSVATVFRAVNSDRGLSVARPSWFAPDGRVSLTPSLLFDPSCAVQNSIALVRLAASPHFRMEKAACFAAWYGPPNVIRVATQSIKGHYGSYIADMHKHLHVLLTSYAK